MSIALDTLGDNISISKRKLKKTPEEALAKAKEIETKCGKKVRFLKQGESFNNEFLTKKKKNI